MSAITFPTTITLDEASALVVKHPSTLLALRKVLGDRVARCEAKGDTHKAARTQRWLDAHPLPGKAPKAPKNEPAPKAPKPKGPGSRGGDPVKYIQARLASAYAGGALSSLDAPGKAAWWAHYTAPETVAKAHEILAKHLASK